MRRVAMILVLLASGALLAAETGNHQYTGTKKCKMCHMKEWKSWQQTKMANAFDILKPGERADAKKAAGLDPEKDYTTDASCLACHTTGYGKPGGFVSLESSPELAGVGCEMCHGAGGTYTQPQHMSLKNKEYKKAEIVQAGLVGEITIEQCSSCHNKKSPFVGDDYVFDFEANKAKGTHEKFELKYAH